MFFIASDEQWVEIEGAGSWFYPRSSHIGSSSKKNPGFSGVSRVIFQPIVSCHIWQGVSDPCPCQSLCLLSAAIKTSAPITCRFLHRAWILLWSFGRDYINLIISLVRLKCSYITLKKIIRSEGGSLFCLKSVWYCNEMTIYVKALEEWPLHAAMLLHKIRSFLWLVLTEGCFI